MKRIFAALLIMALLVTGVGCNAATGGDTESTGKQKVPKQTETKEPTKTETTEPSQPEQAGALMVEQLRKLMAAEDKSFAVAYLGYLSYDYDTLWDFIDGLGSEALEKLPFLQQIPETNMITTAAIGEVYCFIPTDPEAVVEIFTDAAGEEVFYEGSSAEPYLLVCNSEYSADSYVTITDTLAGEEFTMWWYPKLDQYLYVEQPRYASGTTGSLDITPYNEMLLTYYKTMRGDDWDAPTKEDLENTTWYWDGYTQGGIYYEYRVSFHEDTADVCWNPGYGETYEYTNAAWAYEDGEVCVLTIDFAEFAGVRNYNLLVDLDDGIMYIAADATGEDLAWDSEPLYRFLLLDQTSDAQPMDLVGIWERIQSEIEGYVDETPAGQVIVQITGSSEDALFISYQDKAFPDNDYFDTALYIIPDGDILWYGDVAWFAKVNHTGNYGKTFTMAIVDDMLVIQNYFILDSAPTVSYEIFRRVN